MKIRFFLILLLGAHAFASPMPRTLDSEENLLYIFATGPDLYNPDGKSRHEKWNREPDSSYAKGVVDELIERIGLDHPRAKALHLKSFTLENLQKAYSLVPLAQVDRVILAIVSHGGVGNGMFYASAKSGLLFEDELLETIQGTQTDVVFFTCNSGAVRTEKFPGGVFGASLKHTAMDAVHFYGWASFLAANRHHLFPTSAFEFYQSWLEYRIHDQLAGKSNLLNRTYTHLNLSARYKQRCWSDSYPFFFEAAREVTVDRR